MEPARLRPAIRVALAALLVAFAVLSRSATLAREGEKPKPQAGRLAINLTVPREPVGPGKAVPVTVWLVNVGEEPLAVRSPLTLIAPGTEGSVALTLLGPDCRVRKVQAWISPWVWDGWAVVKPGEMLGGTWDLEGIYDLRKDGFYAIQAVYENRRAAPAELGVPAWQGRLAGKVVRFRRAAGEEGR